MENNNIIWSKNLICHNVEIGSHNFIAAGSLIRGFSKILNNNFIDFNSTIIQRKVIEKEVLIGAKSLVINNPNNFSKNFGIPTKEVSCHFKNGIEIN
ncbi:hypothetical protein [Fusobacterium varium]|uniref:hypothetical protein n=1 Tax=Fusobacterium varium TaxID=856 RepID=UPI003A4D95E0